jgi:hypothetical protein
MKAHMESGGIALHLDVRGRVGDQHQVPAFLPRKKFRYPFYRRIVGSRRQYGRVKEI